MPIIVTFTSIPPRFRFLAEKVDSLLNQTRRPDAIELYVPRRYRRFPDLCPELPSLPPEVEVVWLDEDLGPASKVLPAARRYRDDAVDLLLCDDDRVQDRRWVERFARAREERPTDIICESGWHIQERFGLTYPDPPLPRAEEAPRRGRTWPYRALRLLTLHMLPLPRKNYARAGFVDVFEGFDGALVTPRAFHEDVWAIPDIAWTVDDVWLSGMAAAKGTRIWLNDATKPFRHETRADKTVALKNFVHDGYGRSGADRYCFEYLREKYGVWT